MRQSHGLMVNYLYDLDDIEKNHEAFAENRHRGRLQCRAQSSPGRVRPAMSCRSQAKPDVQQKLPETP